MLVRITNQKLIREALDRLWRLREGTYQYLAGTSRTWFEIDDFLCFRRNAYGGPVYSQRLGYVCAKAWQKNWREGYRLVKEYVTINNFPSLVIPFKDIQNMISKKAREHSDDVQARLDYSDRAYVTAMKFHRAVTDTFWANYLEIWDNVVEAYRKKR